MSPITSSDTNLAETETLVTVDSQENNMETETETVVEAPAYQKVHSSSLIPAGHKLVVNDEILHTKNVTVWSNQMAVNLCEGKKARLIENNGITKAAFNILSKWRTSAESFPETDENGLFYLTQSFDQLTSMIGDSDDCGYVNGAYTGKYAPYIVNFAEILADTHDDNPVAAMYAKKAWMRLGMVNGQLKVVKVLKLVAYTPDEDTSRFGVQHNRNAIYQSAALVALLTSEATGVPVLFKWKYNFGYVAAWYIQQFLKTTKQAYEDARAHTVSSQIRKTEMRYQASIEKNGGVELRKLQVSTNNGVQEAVTIAPLTADALTLIDGTKVPVESLLGHVVRRWITPAMPYIAPDFPVNERTSADLVSMVKRLHLLVEIVR
jgi:hypothetical protein